MENLLRVCGYGVPNLSRALYSVANSVTLISQAKLQPFDKRDSRYVSKEMHLYSLPWPRDVLASLGEADATMRVTLSYFGSLDHEGWGGTTAIGTPRMLSDLH